MGELQALLEQHGLTLVFLNVLAEQAGLPVPAYPMLLVAGALGVSGAGPSVGAVLAAVIAACLIADTAWYFAGRHLGHTMLSTICRVSISPDSCIRQTQSLYLKVGARSLVFAKLLPGAGALSTAMAGMHATPLAVFLFYDAIGALVWAGGGLLLGVVFSDAIDLVLANLSNWGHFALWVCLAALALFIAWRWSRRVHILRITRRIPRMTVDELEARRSAGNLPVLLDVRADKLAPGGPPLERIPGALVVDMDRPLDVLSGPAWETEVSEIVVYCACPHEVSAAILAQRLKAAGYMRTWALAGGFDEWKRLHGAPVETGAPREGTEAPAVP